MNNASIKAVAKIFTLRQFVFRVKVFDLASFWALDAAKYRHDKAINK